MPQTGYSNVNKWVGMAIGADATPSIYLPVSKITPKVNQNEYNPKERRGKLNQSFTLLKEYITHTVDLTLDARAGLGLEHLLYAALGVKTSAQQATTTAYKHTLTEDPLTRPVLTLWDGIDTGNAAIKPLKYTNSLLNSLTLSAKSGGELQVQASFNTDPPNDDTTAPTKTFAPAPKPLLFNDMNFQIANVGSAVVQDPTMTSFEVDIKNTITEKQIGDMSLFPGVRIPTDYVVSGKGTKLFQNRDLLHEWFGDLLDTGVKDTYIWKNAQVDFTGPKIVDTYYQKLSLYFPYLIISAPTMTDGDIVEYDFNWKTIENGATPGVDDMLMKAEVTSALTAIA